LRAESEPIVEEYSGP